MAKTTQKQKSEIIDEVKEVKKKHNNDNGDLELSDDLAEGLDEVVTDEIGDLLEGLDDTDDIDANSLLKTSKGPFMDFSDFEEGIEDIDINSEQFMSVVTYGPRGAGKTSFLATCPSPLVLDFNERGTNVLIGTGARRRSIPDFLMAQKAFWFLNSGNHDYETLGLDTMNMMESIVLDYVMGKGSDLDASKDKEMPLIKDYGSRSLLMKRWILAFRNLPMHKIFIIQEGKSGEDDIESEDPTRYPDLSPKVRVFMTAAVDVVGRMYTKEKKTKKGEKVITVDEYLMRLKGNSLMEAKCRVPRGAYCPRVIKDPTFDKLKAIYMGEYKKGE